MAGKILASLSALLSLDTKGFEKGVKSVKSHSTALQSSMKAIGGAIAGAFAVGAIASYTMEAKALAGQMVGVREAFNRIADDKTLEKLREATRGTVSELELMKNAVKANNFKIPLEQLATFFEFATKRAAQTGESVQYLVESIILGIGRKSPLILDNLGISAIELRKKLKGVGMESASVADVSKAMGEIIEEEMVKMGDVTETAGQKMERLKATSEDMKTAWGELANTVSKMVAPAMTEFAKTMKVGLEGMQAMADSKSLSFWDKVKITLFSAGRNAEGVGEILGKNLNPEMEQTGQAANNLNGILDENKENLEKDAEAAKKAAAELERLRKEYRDLQKDSMKKITGGISPVTTDELTGSGAMTDQQSKILDAMSTVGGSRITGMQLPVEQVEDMEMALRELPGTYATVTEEMEATSQRLKSAFESIGSALGNAIGEFIKGEAKFSDVATSLIQEIIKVVAGYLTETVAASFAGGASAGGPAAAFTGAAAAAAALSMFGAIVPALMAKGGVVPSGFQGDTYPALLSSGETVLPAPHKLDAMAGAQRVIVEGRIRGQDIYFANEKQTSKLSRYR